MKPTVCVHIHLSVWTCGCTVSPVHIPLSSHWQGAAVLSKHAVRCKLVFRLASSGQALTDTGMRGQNGLFVQLSWGRSFTTLSVCEDKMNPTFAESPVCLPFERGWITALISRCNSHTHQHAVWESTVTLISRSALLFNTPELLCMFGKWLSEVFPSPLTISQSFRV